ncbi:GNAT family N-acetyltransferase [Solwaraspora sp. WMMD1047]|uniref:GNAT family N-acetyltransferase n=1 Tax=Solwaraspora sp. WMMD1047 TaxID=3016102 RepID=UPI0024169E19|nr:GNAT family N-acetyltransferase [Solwaraspora sp. WMMD1047]MDG4829596.1 GNAT family N-acetyltransferase [Solwaraspora sp. WMMD1047]
MGQWYQASDPTRVHRLLEASDRASAGDSTDPPKRSMRSTERAVAAGWVWVLREDDQDVAMITVSTEWSGDAALLAHFPATDSPRYMRRLAVAPDRHGTGSLLSMRTIRKALEIAQSDGGTAMRCETNPRDEGAVRVLHALGFHRYGPEIGRPPTSAILLSRAL